MLASRFLPVPRRQLYGIGCALVWIVAMLIHTGGPSEAAETGREGLVLEYKFETDAKDSSGNARHGSTIGKPRFVAGKSGQCIELDGHQGYVDCGTTLADLDQTFTVECWIKPADRQNLHADVFGNHNHGGYGFVVEQDADNTNRFAAAYGAGSGQWVGTRPVAIAAGKWQHLALVKTPAELRLYVNGIPMAAVRNSAPMVPSPLTLRVGDSIGEVRRCFRGQIDEFRVWRKAVTEFDLGLSPEEKLEALARAVGIQVRSVEPSRPAPDGKTVWSFAVDELLATCIPSAVQEIILEMEAEDWRDGDRVSLPPLTVRRQSAFCAEYSPPLKPGYYRVRAKPIMVVKDQRIAGSAEEFSSAVYGPPLVSAAGVPEKPLELSPQVELPRVVSLDGEGWLIAADPKNEGRQQKWFASPAKDAKPAKVPGPIQDVFPDYHGVAWYWRDFTAPALAIREGRYLLRFHAVDYLAEVWVNGVPIGGHEGGETPFVLDATSGIKPGQANRLAVRVLNPTYESIDGIALKQTPSGAKQYPVATNSAYNCGGILDAVELLLAPAVRIEDLYAIPDWKSGEIRVRASVRNATGQPGQGLVQLTVAPAAGGESLGAQLVSATLPAGATLVEGRLRVPGHRLWRLNDPYLYRVTARVQAAGSAAAYEQSVRCGFRDFRFEDGYFRLNGERIFLHGVIHLAHYPIGYTWPADLDWMRRDVLHMKAAGINLCRFSFGGSLARQLDVFDELGVMVCMEHYASWQMQESPHMKRRFERSLGEVILRDRNDPSVVAWGILNETGAGDPAFRHGVQSLPLVRWLDADRMCILNSGRWDSDWTIGSLSNPGSQAWDGELRDTHGYPPVPHDAGLLRSMRTSSAPQGFSSGAAPAPYPLFVSEYGMCGAVDLIRTVRRYEQLGKQQADDARYYRRQLDKFLADWQAWQLDQIWARPEDFFVESHGHFAKLRRIGENALRANPHLVAFSSTHPIVETGFCGSGTTNAFRELKPGLIDTAWELAAPLRWCLFVEPVNVYRGTRVRLEAVLANEDVLRPGKYPVLLQVVGPKMTRVWEQTITIEIPDRGDTHEPPFAQPVFAGDVLVDGPSGKYRFLATMLQGGAPLGGETEFYASEPAEMPAVTREIVLWGEDVELGKWLAARGVRSRPFVPGQPTAREVILASGKAPAPGGPAVFAELARRVARGSAVVFLDPATLSDGQNATRWAPLKDKGLFAGINWVG